VDPTFDASTTALFSTIDGFDLNQLLIPKALIGPNGGQTFNVQCAQAGDQASVDVISVYGEAQYDSWGIKGSKTDIP
jgi:Family of unknown function (DUF5910)